MVRIKELPEDFVVEEELLYPLSGEGSHTYLLVEKRDATTDQVARALAIESSVGHRDVGFAGRKDRYAVARQWFSVPSLDRSQVEALSLPNCRILAVEQHHSKLRLGEIERNRFCIRVREVRDADREAAIARFESIEARGFPNRFGRQRFGRYGDNAERGAALLRGEGPRVDRRTLRFLISALQSAVFNRLLEIRSIGIDEVRRGDLAFEHATGSVFPVVDEAEASLRAERFEISATGPLFGLKVRRAQGASGEEEDRALLDFGLVDLHRLRLPRGVRLPGQRRPLRVRPEEGRCVAVEDGLEVAMALPSGVYATVLIEELFPGEEVVEGEHSDPGAADGGGDAVSVDGVRRRQGEGRDLGVEDLAGGGDHLVAPLHGADGGG